MLPQIVIALALATTALHAATDSRQETAPPKDEQQLAMAMRSASSENPVVRVGQAEADLIGKDNRALQGALDYLASLGGGTLEIGPGEYLMRDSLHLRSNVIVRGTPGRTILRKAEGVQSPLAIDGDFGEEQITVRDATGFDVGCGVAIWSKRENYFHATVARVIGKTGATLALDKPLNADCLVSDEAMAATVFPVVSGCNIQGARVEHLTIEGNRDHNPALDGCRGGGIYLYRGFGTVIDSCTVRNYNGDGISFQQSNDVIVRNCVSEGNASLGLHPGSGSQRATIQRCTARNNGADGLFLCWRVRHGRFEENVLENNGRFGISIGHKDTDNVLRRNQVRSNGEDGVHFRNETIGMAGHRNLLEENAIENNGTKGNGAGIRVRGETRDIVLRRNVIRDTRPTGQTQNIGIALESKAGPVTLEENAIQATTPMQDQRETR